MSKHLPARSKSRQWDLLAAKICFVWFGVIFLTVVLFAEHAREQPWIVVLLNLEGAIMFGLVGLWVRLQRVAKQPRPPGAVFVSWAQTMVFAGIILTWFFGATFDQHMQIHWWLKPLFVWEIAGILGLVAAEQIISGQFYYGSAFSGTLITRADRPVMFWTFFAFLVILALAFACWGGYFLVN